MSWLRGWLLAYHAVQESWRYVGIVCKLQAGPTCGRHQRTSHHAAIAVDGPECGSAGPVVVGWVPEPGGDGAIDVGNDAHSGRLIAKSTLDHPRTGGHPES